MKQFVQIFLNFILIFALACDAEESAAPTIQDIDLVEVYVQISLIQDSNLGDIDKNILIDKYLSDKKLTMKKIDTRLESYRVNPAEWRSFFMKVQSRLRELQRETREKTFEESDSVIQIVDSGIGKTISPFPNIIRDTVITSSFLPESEVPISEELPDDSITTEDEATFAEPIFSSGYQAGSFESEDLGLFAYEIQPGDNLSSLASLYDTDTELLVIINGIVSANSIRIGQNILIPNAVTNIIIHTIESGEAISRISVRYDSDVEQIIFLNQIDNVNAININDLLYIPVRKTGSEGNN